MKNKVPIIVRLINERWFDSEKEACAWIMERKVLIDERPVLSPKEAVSPEAAIRIKNEYKRRFVNKGGLKLEGAMERLKVDVTGKTALDCGASTGGFTDCLLQRGAARVYAVDAGFGQLAGKLQSDPRVVNMEKTNLGDACLLKLEPKPEIITLDLSYLSLKKALPLCENILGLHGLVVCLVKPLFEVEDTEIRRTGELSDPKLLTDILLELYDFFIKRQYKVLGITHSAVTGNEGTVEYFYSLSLDVDSAGIARDVIAEDIAVTVDISLKLNQFKKT
jgi:23S rRNA (cytidine1920-2'-O)/16S rRNA (cytidine1409-2'-O)-methyltransferase